MFKGCMIFNDINVNGKEIWEIKPCAAPKKVKLGFEIGLPVNETQFWKTAVAKNNSFYIS